MKQLFEVVMQPVFVAAILLLIWKGLYEFVIDIIDFITDYFNKNKDKL